MRGSIKASQAKKKEKEAKKMEWGKGLVQRDEADKRRKEEQAMRNQAFARTADDKELNEQLKAEERWNDPAAAFLTVRVCLLCDAMKSLTTVRMCNRRRRRKGRDGQNTPVPLPLRTVSE